MEHQKIFSAIVELFNKTQPVDILTVSEELKRMKQLEKIGGISYITELTNNISSSSNTEFHARIVAEKYIKRSLISISNNIIGEAFDDSIDIFDHCKSLGVLSPQGFIINNILDLHSLYIVTSPLIH